MKVPFIEDQLGPADNVIKWETGCDPSAGEVSIVIFIIIACYNLTFVYYYCYCSSNVYKRWLDMKIESHLYVLQPNTSLPDVQVAIYEYNNY